MVNSELLCCGCGENQTICAKCHKKEIEKARQDGELEGRNEILSAFETWFQKKWKKDEVVLSDFFKFIYELDKQKEKKELKS